MTCPHCNKDWSKIASIGSEPIDMDMRPAVCLQCGEISITKNGSLHKLSDTDIVLIKRAELWERICNDSKNAKRRIKENIQAPAVGYKKIDLFGRHTSRGTFDDFFKTEKYKTMQEAYEANDYVECDYVIDQNNIIYIEARHVKNPDVRKYHRLNWQYCPAGIDILDDQLACEMADTLL